jgi:hypothetical protein
VENTEQRLHILDVDCWCEPEVESDRIQHRVPDGQILYHGFPIRNPAGRTAIDKLVGNESLYR